MLLLHSKGANLEMLIGVEVIVVARSIRVTLLSDVMHVQPALWFAGSHFQ